MQSGELADEVSRYTWYHTIDLGNGVITAGMFDHRGILDRSLLPDSLHGMRCLDVGTMDGFWAFEMERRGAAEVIAADLDNPADLDWPPRYAPGTPRILDEAKDARFEIVRSALGSSVRRVLRSVYTLDTDLGEFDLVYCGDLLIHLSDPARALARIRRVCRGSAIICNPIVRFRGKRRRPLAEFDGIDQFQWWALSSEAIERMMLAADFARVDVGEPFELPARGSSDWKGLRGVFRGWV